MNSTNKDFVPFPESSQELLEHLTHSLGIGENLMNAVLRGDYEEAQRVAGQLLLIQELRNWNEETQAEILKTTLSSH